MRYEWVWEAEVGYGERIVTSSNGADTRVGALQKAQDWIDQRVLDGAMDYQRVIIRRKGRNE